MEKISKYIEDKRFIRWVFNPDEELNKWWATYNEENPGEKNNIELAQKVILKLKTKDRKLSEEEKILLFSSVLKQIEEKQQKSKKTGLITGFLKYAAVAILFFSIGSVLFYRQNNYNSQFYSQNLEQSMFESEAKLIRANGEKISLNQKKSVIEYATNGLIKVNDSVYKRPEKVEKGNPELNQLVIPYGNTSEIYLPDGSHVYLNAGSRLVYPEYFSDKIREVFLVGEAFFEIKQDKDHPFVVQTTDLRIKVLGTRFNVSAYASDNIIETVLTEGKVRLEQNVSGIFSESNQMVPNQLAAFNKNTGEISLKTVDPDNYTLWKDGLCKFESTDLNRVLKKLERYYNIRFNYSDPFLGTIKLSGKLDLEENREEVINRVSVAASVQIIKKGEFLYEIKQ